MGHQHIQQEHLDTLIIFFSPRNAQLSSASVGRDSYMSIGNMHRV